MTANEWMLFVGPILGVVLYKLKQYSRCLTLIAEEQRHILEDLTRPAPKKRGAVYE